MNLNKFKAYLLENGCEIFEPTNEYEWCRFKVNGQTAIIYSGKFVGSGFVGDAKEVFNSYRNKEKFPFLDHKNTALLRQRGKHLMALVKRDENECFYCATELVAQ